MFATRAVLALVVSVGVHAHESAWWKSAKAEAQEVEAQEPSWWESLKSTARSTIELESDAAHPLDLLRDAGGMNVETCGQPDDLMQVRDVQFDLHTRTVTATGLLSKEVDGGEVRAHIRLGDAPLNTTRAQRMKRAMVFIAKGKHTAKEELCRHIARGGKLHGQSAGETCPLAAGEQALHFSFDRLPSAITAGKFHLTMSAVDRSGASIACIKGSLYVPTGPRGEMVRRLQQGCDAGYTSCGCFCDWDSDCAGDMTCRDGGPRGCRYDFTNCGDVTSAAFPLALSGVLASLLIAATGGIW